MNWRELTIDDILILLGIFALGMLLGSLVT